MALVSLGGSRQLITPGIGLNGMNLTTTTQTAMDAAGESTSFIGYLQWDDEASHTVSSAGGKIYWMATAVGAFANASSNIRVGLQDVDDTTGLEDGTFDVHDDLVGGTDTITANVINTVTMSSGSKTVAHGGLVAIVIEMTARGGADSVSPARLTEQSAGLPYCAIDSGSGPSKSLNSFPYALVQADDGAMGLFGPFPSMIPAVFTNTSFNSASTDDEYAMLFQVPYRCAVDKLVAVIGELDAGEGGTITLYSLVDPSNPFDERSVSIDPDIFAASGAVVLPSLWNIPEFTLEPNTTYAVAYNATTAGSRLIRRVTTIPGANVRKFTPFGTTLLGGVRTDTSGAFTTSTTDWPMLGFMISKLDNGVSAGGVNRALLPSGVSALG